jgi:hypothetical protein
MPLNRSGDRARALMAFRQLGLALLVDWHHLSWRDGKSKYYSPRFIDTVHTSLTGVPKYTKQSLYIVEG